MKKLTDQPDPWNAWIYDKSHPEYNSERAKDLRMRREKSLAAVPRWIREPLLDHEKADA